MYQGGSRKGKNDYLRSCDFCGYLVLRSTMKRKDGYLACKDDARGKERMTLDKLNALGLKPRRWKPADSRLSDRDNEIDVYQADEAAVFSLLTSHSGQRQVALSSGTNVGGTAPARALAYQGLALYGVLAENKRPAAWLASASAALRSLADTLIARQFTANAALSPLAGGFPQVVNGAAYDAESTGAAGLCLLRAYQWFGDLKYLTGAQLAANFIRNLQWSGFAATAYTSTDSAGVGRLYTGAWSHAMSLVSEFGGDAANRYDHLFYPSDLVALEFLRALLDAVGDGSYGSSTTVTGFFSTPPAAQLSAMIADATAFWTGAGTKEASSSSTVNGFSVATPREFFNAWPANKQSLVFTQAGTGNWEYQDGGYAAGSLVSSLNWAKGIHALNAIGQTAKAKELWLYLQGLAANPSFATPANTGDAVVFRGLTGAFDATLAPPTLFNARTGQNGSSLYDWAAWGLLAALQSKNNPSRLLSARKALGQKQYRTHDNTDHDVPTDFVGKIGQSGLSLQTSFALNADLELAALVEFGYRVAPHIFSFPDDGRATA